MSFNIRYGTAPDGTHAWPNRKHLVSRVIRQAKPDIIGTQEALKFQLDELRKAFPVYAMVGVGRDDGDTTGEYSALLVDTTRFVIEEGGTFWLSDTPGKAGSATWGNRITRICTWARLRDRADGGIILVFNTHWDHESQPSRERSAGLILDSIAAKAGPEMPVVLLGDFNAGEKNPAFGKLLSHPSVRLRDTFRELHPDAGEVGTFNAFRGATGGEKIDAVLVSPAWRVLRAEIDRTTEGGLWPSDHFAVVAVAERGKARRE